MKSLYKNYPPIVRRIALMLCLTLPMIYQSKAQCMLGIEEADDGGARGGIDVIYDAPQVLVSEVIAMAQFYQLEVPEVKMYNEPQNSSAHTVCMCQGGGCGSKIFIGVNLWNQLAPNGFVSDGLRTILAHEMAHVLQCKYGLNRYENDKAKEQAADFFAGYYLGKRQLYGMWADLQGSVWQIISRGDLQFNKDSGHGTSKERYMSISLGFYGANTVFNVPVESIPMHLFSKNRFDIPVGGWYTSTLNNGNKSFISWVGVNLVATQYDPYGGLIGTNTFKQSYKNKNLYVPINPNTPDEELFVIDPGNILYISHAPYRMAFVLNRLP